MNFKTQLLDFLLRSTGSLTASLRLLGLSEGDEDLVPPINASEHHHHHHHKDVPWKGSRAQTSELSEQRESWAVLENKDALRTYTKESFSGRGQPASTMIPRQGVLVLLL